MTAADRSKFLPLALRVVGLIFTFGFYPLTVLWPSGWAWHSSGRSEYLEMIVAVARPWACSWSSRHAIPPIISA